MILIRYLEDIVVSVDKEVSFITIKDQTTDGSSLLSELESYLRIKSIKSEICIGPPSNTIYLEGGPKCLAILEETSSLNSLIYDFESNKKTECIIGKLSLKNAQDFVKRNELAFENP